MCVCGAVSADCARTVAAPVGGCAARGDGPRGRADGREPESAQTDLPSSIKYDIYTRPHFVVRVGRSSRKAALTHHGSAPRPPAPPLSIDHATMDLLRLRPAVLCTPSRGEAGDGTFPIVFGYISYQIRILLYLDVSLHVEYLGCILMCPVHIHQDTSRYIKIHQDTSRYICICHFGYH